MRQFSYTFQPNSNKATVQAFNTHPLVHPEEFLSAVAIGDEIKLHALVDDTQPVETYEILIVGTGQVVPDALVDRLYKVGAVLLHGMYGYHVYFLGQSRSNQEAEVEVKPAFALKLEWKADLDDEEASEFNRLNADIDSFVGQHDDACELLMTEDQDKLAVIFFNERYRQHPEFIKLMLDVCANTAVQEFSLVIGEEIDL